VNGSRLALCAWLASFLGQAFAQAPQLPATDPVAAMRERFCGGRGVPPVSSSIPEVGCFTVPGSSSASLSVAEAKFEIMVDAEGGTTCRLDGEPTNCQGCIGPHNPKCPVLMRIVGSNDDHSASFSVQRRADDLTFISSLQAWNEYLKSKADHTVEQTPQPAKVPVAATVAPTPSPANTIADNPESNGAMDGPGALEYVGWEAQRAFEGGRFAELDQLIASLSQPSQLTDDGMPRLHGVILGLFGNMSQFREWGNYLRNIAQWRKESPDSYAADLVEVIVLRAWAWRMRGDGYAASVKPEAWTLYQEKISRASALLEKCKPRASRSPLWYQLSLGIARDAEWDKQRYRALFEEARRRFPWYVPLYDLATNYLSPLWSGSFEAVDALAQSTLATPQGRDHSLYARVYWHLTSFEPQDFDLFHDSLASWPEMKTGFESLMRSYPKSRWNLNVFASFACRADDAATYGPLRTRIGKGVWFDAWPTNYSIEVCDAHLLTGT
jgi:hypothetical protein